MQTNWRKKKEHTAQFLRDPGWVHHYLFRSGTVFPNQNMKTGLSIIPNNWREPSNAKTFCKECVL